MHLSSTPSFSAFSRGLPALFECGPDQRGRRALVGIESLEFRPLEADGVLVAEDEAHANLAADVVGEEERGRDTPTEEVESAGTGQVVQREAGLGWRVVTHDDELPGYHVSPS